MNREQRRRQMQRTDHTVKEFQMNTQMGYNDEKVLLQFSRHINIVMLTPDECQEWINNLTHLKQCVLDRQEEIGRGRPN